MCVSYEECRVAVGLLQRVSVVLGRSVCVCVCVVRLMPVVVGRPERVSVSCWAGLSVCVCVLRGMLSSRLSAGESECVVLCRSVCVCVCHTRNAE